MCYSKPPAADSSINKNQRLFDNHTQEPPGSMQPDCPMLYALCSLLFRKPPIKRNTRQNQQHPQNRFARLRHDRIDQQADAEENKDRGDIWVAPDFIWPVRIRHFPAENEYTCCRCTIENKHSKDYHVRELVK